MRIEVIKCDECKKEQIASDAHTEYVLPASWVTVMQGHEERHFCSTECLIAWAKKQGIGVEVFGVTQHELMGEGTKHYDTSVPSAPLTRWPSGKAF